jgi:hypothetical protein
MSKWQTLSSEEVYETPWIKVRAFLARNVQQTDHKLDEDKQISNGQFFDLDHIENMAKNNDFVESAHLATLYTG